MRRLLEQVGLEPERVAFYNLSSSEGPRFAQIATDLTGRIQALGPNPLRQGRTKDEGHKPYGR